VVSSRFEVPAGAGLPLALERCVRTEEDQRNKRAPHNSQDHSDSPDDAELARRVEEAVKGVPDVVTVRAVVKRGEVTDIHVSAAARHSNFKQLARDIRTKINADLRFDVDYRVISIVGVQQMATAHAGPRLEFRSVGFNEEGKTAEARVELARLGDSYKGVRGVSFHEHDEVRLVAEATLNAVMEFIIQSSTEDDGNKVSLTLERVRIERDGDAGGMIAAWVRFSRQGGEEVLLGCVPVGNSIRQAAAKAALDAVNRRLGWFME